MTDQPAPIVSTRYGDLRGRWRPNSAEFLGIPFAQAPIGALRFAAPVPAEPWRGVRDATEMGPTPQRRPLADITTIPEPSIPGLATLNLNVFTPRPGDRDARLPVLVWIHGGGYTAGSPASPWYDGRAFNRDGVVTVTISYRLGFDGYGWMADTPTNRAVRDQILALEWVRDNIAEFGGDPGSVTIGGQSAGGGSVLCLLACPAAQGLFHRVISHSGAAPVISAAEAERSGREFAEQMAVEPTRAGWSSLDELEILDHQGAGTAVGEDPFTQLRGLVAGQGASAMLTWAPQIDGDLLPYAPDDAACRGIGADKELLLGSVAHEFSMSFMSPPGEGSTAPGNGVSGPVDPFERPRVELLAAAGLTAGAIEVVDRYFGDLPDRLCLGQVLTEFLFRIPALEAAGRPGRTWLYDFRWADPHLHVAYHCLDLPFAWDLLDAPGTTEVLGANPPAELAKAMHGAWVRFIRDGDPGWAMCGAAEEGAGRPGMVFDADSQVSAAPYRAEAELAAAMGREPMRPLPAR